MKSFKLRIAYLVCMLVLRVFINSSLVYGASDEQAGDQMTPDALVTVALFAGFGGAGMTGQGINPAVNGEINPPAASALGTGFHVTGAVHAKTDAHGGTVNVTKQRTRTECQDSCSL